MSLYACHTPGITTSVLLILKACGLVVRSCHTVERLPCRKCWKGERPSWGRLDRMNIRRTGTGNLAGGKSLRTNDGAKEKLYLRK